MNDLDVCNAAIKAANVALSNLEKAKNDFVAAKGTKDVKAASANYIKAMNNYEVSVSATWDAIEKLQEDNDGNHS